MYNIEKLRRMINMNREIKTQINEKAMRIMSQFQLFKLRRASFIVTSIALLVGIATSIYALTMEENKTAYIVILVLLPLLYIFLFVLSPMLTAKSALKRLKLEKGEIITYDYRFNDEQFDVNLYFGTSLRANNSFQYDAVKSLYEYKNYLYIIMKENFAFIINKEDASEEEINEVKAYLLTKIGQVSKSV
jgi:hypothetical protein